MLSWKVNPESLKRLNREFNKLDDKIKRKAIRNGLKKFAKVAEAAIRQNITWDEGTIQDYIDYKIISRKKGRIFWVGIGVQSGKYVRVSNKLGYEVPVALKARWYNDGFRPYPKGRPTNRKGRNWRKGLRGVGGPKWYRTKFIEKAQEQIQPLALDIIAKSIQNAINSG